MKKARLLLVMTALFGFVWTWAAPQASAQTGANPRFCQQHIGGFLGFPTWYKYLNPEIVTTYDAAGNPTSTCKIDFEFTPASVGAVLIAVLEIILRVAAILAVVFVVVGGVQMQLGQGEPDQTAKARTTIINALIGLLLALSATIIINFIGNNLK